MQSYIKAEEIIRYLESQTDAMQSFLYHLVRCESPSNDSNTQNAIFEYLMGEFEQLEFSTIRVPGKKTGGYLFARPNQRKKNQASQLILGHCDTVWPLGTLTTMPLHQDNNRISGPGIYDMKAGLTQIVYALKTLKFLGHRPALLPLVLVNADEEIGSRESSGAIRRLAKVARRAYVLEPPLGLDGKLKTARKGLGRFTIEVEGEAAHAGLDPGKGASAIAELSHQIQKLFDMNDFEKGISVNVGMIEGGVSANVVAPTSRAVIDVRVLHHEDRERISQQIFNLQPSLMGTKLNITGGFGRPPMERTTRNQKLWKQAKATAQLLNLDLEQGTAGGGSDGNTTSLYTATLDGLGTVGDGAHASHEFIFSDKLIERSALLTLLLMNEDDAIQ